MTTTTEATVDTTVDDERRDALVERLFGSLLGGMELLSIDLGRRLGLYATLSESGAQTAAGFARRAGIAERYAREWLEQQAVAGVLDVDAPDRPSAERRYTLPAAHADVLVHAEHPANLMGAAPSLTGLALTLSAVAEAYRTGTGVSYADFGADIRHGIGAFDRPMFVGELAGTCLALPEVRDRLAQGGRVLDVGCGTGWSSIALARAFPQTTVVGIDLDEASIADARDNAERADVADRVTFEVRNAAT